MGKAFEKQIKTIEDQGGKQIKAIQGKGQVKTIKKYANDTEDTPSISKQKEIFNELVDERLEEITSLDKKVSSDNLNTRVKLLMQNLLNLIMLLVLSIKYKMAK